MVAAISVRNLTKRFQIPLDRSATLKYRVIHLRSASRYRTLLAVDDVSFDVDEGTFLGIIGRNGSGKSTLLKVLSQIYRPSSGSVLINGHISPFLELGVGFNPELTARENVVLNGAILGLSRREMTKRMEEILHFAELEEFADTKLKNYSSGMQVRLAFTVAIQAEAGVLLMDEVLAVGDARFQTKCFDIFNRYKREGRTIILVTHDLGAVELYCDRALMLDHGKLASDGGAAEVASVYRRMIGDLEDAERRATGGALIDLADIRPGEGRWGTGKARVISVQLLRSDGSQHVNFTSQEPMTIRIEVEARQDMDDLVVGIGIHRADGTFISGTNSRIGKARIPRLPAGGKAIVDYAVPDLPLLGGTYRLSIALHPVVHTETYDQLDYAFEFAVTDDSGRIGMFELGGQWRVQIPSAAELPVQSER